MHHPSEQDETGQQERGETGCSHLIALLLTKLPVPPEEKQGEPTRNPDIAV
jgi:hypothetical protein